MSRLKSRSERSLFAWFVRCGLRANSGPIAAGAGSAVVAAGLLGACGPATADENDGRRPTIIISVTNSAGMVVTMEVPATSVGATPSGIILVPTASAAPPGSKPPGCGNGKLTSDEACDDKNEQPGDGCSAICTVEDGWSCLDNMCVRVPLCGDSTIDLAESCDDGNTVAGDGCNETCATEEGWACPVQGMPCSNLVVCNNGTVEGAETCDDRNNADGDGCSAACQTEAGWVCTPGAACTALCGDAKVGPGETCDDGNTTAGDGCSGTCVREPSTGDGLSWECPDDLGTGGPCVQAVCGDGKVEGDEGCDDLANNNLGDGCSPGCKLEPDCSAGACKSTCGDGLILATDNEACDDGNKRDGDGCSSVCQLEDGFKCERVEATAGNTLTLPIIYRDFRGKGLDFAADVRDAYDAMGHADFENFDFSVANASYEPATGIVAATLSTDAATRGKPVYAATSAAAKLVVTGKAQFDQWFNDVPGVNMTVRGEIDLTRVGGQYIFDEDDFYPLDDDGLVGAGDEKARTKTWGDPEGNTFELSCWDALRQAAVWSKPNSTCEDRYEPYYRDGEVDNTDADCVDTHNYSFTSEVRYWFEYKGGEELIFEGDDDVFVFINKKLVVDLGGLHEPLGGDVCGQVWPIAQNDNSPFGCDVHDGGEDGNGVCIDAGEGMEMTPPACGGLGAADSVVRDLVVGNVYEVAVFQAERHTCQSNYRLTLGGFTQSSSACAPECGDGVVTAGEACDEGAMNGAGYNHCTATCTFGPRCGDGIPQLDAGEACDNGKNISQYQDAPDACAPGCFAAPTCGDGQLNPKGNEQCDLGAANTGTYGGCNMDCTFAPRCGDSVLHDMDGETCDDGNRKNGDGCDAACRKEPPIIPT
jgi:fibro-slime domain-containing protein